MCLSDPRSTVLKVTAAVTRDATLSRVTRDWLARAERADRKRLGQFMTPRVVRERLIDALDLWPGMRVLDPGAGTGEFLRSILDRQPEAIVTGWDVDPVILESARELVPEATLEERSALEPYQGEPFDLVVGNPPYFQFRAAREVKNYFAQVISGRPNIFALFFQAGFEALRSGGRVAYVVPPSMNNGAYFEALREFIVVRSEVEYLEVLEGAEQFEDANTAVQLIVMHTGARGKKHTFTRTTDSARFRRTIFSQRPELLEAQFEGRTTLWEQGYEAVTGTIVWNQNRERLRRDPDTGTVPLIWAHNLQGGKLVLTPEHPKRPQYVAVDRRLTGPAIVINRITGSVGAGEVRCARIPDGMEFVGENHVNVVRPRVNSQQRVGWEPLLESLQRPEVVSRVRLLTGNTQASATELTHLIPLDI